MLPKDPNILFSLINTRLRDTNTTLDELCAALLCTREDICIPLEKIGYVYNEEMNKFVGKTN